MIIPTLGQSEVLRVNFPDKKVSEDEKTTSSYLDRMRSFTTGLHTCDIPKAIS